jgi:hypothetical protein
MTDMTDISLPPWFAQSVAARTLHSLATLHAFLEALDDSLLGAAPTRALLDSSRLCGQMLEDVADAPLLGVTRLWVEPFLTPWLDRVAVALSGLARIDAAQARVLRSVIVEQVGGALFADGWFRLVVPLIDVDPFSPARHQASHFASGEKNIVVGIEKFGRAKGDGILQPAVVVVGEGR